MTSDASMIGAPSPATAKRALKCVVLTPVGPGHDTLAKDAQASVEAAYKMGTGPFEDVIFLPLQDPEGKIGRSRRRNDGIQYALANNIDWIFFLDADDLMAPDAFLSATPYIDDYDAVFGMIAEMGFGESDPIKLRANQLGKTTALADILRFDPVLSLQMGHFVRTTAAASLGFDVTMDTGEDFKYYLALWKQFRCTKIDQFLFVNRRGRHSSGPRSADGVSWRRAVGQVFADFCADNNLMIAFPWEGKTAKFLLGNPMDLIHQFLMAGRFFETEELSYLRTIVPPGATIVEVGANIGNHLVYYGLYLEPKLVIPIEPNPAAIALLQKNIELNQLSNIDTSRLGFGAGEQYARVSMSVLDTSNLGSSHLVDSDDGEIEVYPLDAKIHEKVDLLKIDVERMELEVLRGATRVIAESQPILFIEIMNENIESFEQWIKTNNYKVIQTFSNVNAKNFVAVHLIPI